MPNCLVAFCKNRENREKDFYKVPIRKYHSWMRAIGRNPEDKIPVEQATICSDHFSADSYVIVGNRRLLKPPAVPTLNLKPPRSSLESHLKPKKDYSNKKIVDSHCITVEDEDFDTNVRKKHDEYGKRNTLDLNKTGRKRYSVRTCHNYYVCSRKYKNKLHWIRKECNDTQRELRMATSSIKMLTCDVKRLTERIDDLTDIVKLYVRKPSRR